MTRWGMVIDLKKCIGCYSCMVACKQENYLPPKVFWNRVVVTETGTYPMVRKQMFPVLCNHCKEAACVKVCPTRATTRREDGIVLVDYDKCVGCRYCLVACPYQQRTFFEDGEYGYFPGQELTELETIGKELGQLQPGTVIKCKLCSERIDEGQKKGMKPGTDREATPACVITCPAKARYFGDLEDPESEVAILIKERSGFVLHPEYGTEPSVYYIS